MTGKAKVGYNEYGTEGKPWYVSDGLNNKDSYIRHDLTEHGYMGIGGGTYFNTKEEAQAVCDVYNRKQRTTGITIQEGKYYVTKDGTKVGPAEYIGGSGKIRWNISKEGAFIGYYDDGEVCIDWPEMTIAGEWTPEEDTKENTEMNTQDIQVGLTHQCVGGYEFTCIYIEDDKAWMKRAGNNEAPAYVWNKDTGATISLGVDTGYNLKRSFVTV